MEQRQKYVLWFQECDISSAPIVGGKCASLGELLKAQIPVPPGFTVTTATYNRFIEENKLDQEIKRLLKPVRPEDTASGEAASQAIRKIIEDKPISVELEDISVNFTVFFPRAAKSPQCRLPFAPAAQPKTFPEQALPASRTHTCG